MKNSAIKKKYIGIELKCRFTLGKLQNYFGETLKRGTKQVLNLFL